MEHQGAQYIERIKKASRRFEFAGSVGGLIVIMVFGGSCLTRGKEPASVLACLMLPFVVCCGIGALLQRKLPCGERTVPRARLLRIYHPYSTFFLFFVMELLLLLLAVEEKLAPGLVNALLFGIGIVLISGEIALYVWAVLYDKERGKREKKKRRGGRGAR